MPNTDPHMTEPTSSRAESPRELWMVLAVIQPFKLDAVTLALEQLPEFGGMTVVECRGFGRNKMHEDASERADVLEFERQLRLEIAVAGSSAADSVLETIVRHAHTGRAGDGKVFTIPIGQAVRVRTNESDARAL